MNLSHNDPKFDHLLADMETAVSLKAQRLPVDNPRSFLDEMLYRVEAANTRNEIPAVKGLRFDPGLFSTDDIDRDVGLAADEPLRPPEPTAQDF